MFRFTFIQRTFQWFFSFSSLSTFSLTVKSFSSNLLSLPSSLLVYSRFFFNLQYRCFFISHFLIYLILYISRHFRTYCSSFSISLSLLLLLISDFLFSLFRPHFLLLFISPPLPLSSFSYFFFLPYLLSPFLSSLFSSLSLSLSFFLSFFLSVCLPHFRAFRFTFLPLFFYSRLISFFYVFYLLLVSHYVCSFFLFLSFFILSLSLSLSLWFPLLPSTYLPFLFLLSSPQLIFSFSVTFYFSLHMDVTFSFFILSFISIYEDH